jgi:hypothetical protein
MGDQLFAIGHAVRPDLLAYARLQDLLGPPAADA